MDLSTVTFDPTKMVIGRQSVMRFTDGAGVKQVETATAVGAITTSGNLTATFTGAGVTGSPIALAVAVLNGDTAAMWAQKVRLALQANAPIMAVYEVLAALDATITLRRRTPAANDATLNLALADGTCVGVTAAASSVDTTAGAASGPVTDLLVEYLSHAPGLATASAQAPGAGNNPAYIGAVWETERSEMLKFRCKEIPKVITMLGSLSGLKNGSSQAYIRDPRDVATVALITDAFASTVYRDPAEAEFSKANPTEVTIVVQSRKDGPIEFTPAGTP